MSTLTLHGLSLTQPFASLVALGEKRIETRKWNSYYRGPIAIHAAKGFPDGMRRLCALREPFKAVLQKHGFRVSDALSPRFMPTGAIVALADLTAVYKIPHAVQHFPARDARYETAFPETKLDQYQSILLPPSDGFPSVRSHEYSFGDYTPGRFAWVLSNIRALPRPIHCKGALGLWEVPVSVRLLLEEQLQIREMISNHTGNTRL